MKSLKKRNKHKKLFNSENQNKNVNVTKNTEKRKEADEFMQQEQFCSNFLFGIKLNLFQLNFFWDVNDVN